MDRSSKILLWIVFLAIIASVGFMYKEYMIDKDFVILQNDSGLPDELEE